MQVAILSYIAYKLFVFFRADGDFTVISKRLKPEYFKGKVIWITGASSGSEYLIIASYPGRVKKYINKICRDSHIHCTSLCLLFEALE